MNSEKRAWHTCLLSTSLLSLHHHYKGQVLRGSFSSQRVKCQNEVLGKQKCVGLEQGLVVKQRSHFSHLLAE